MRELYDSGKLEKDVPSMAFFNLANLLTAYNESDRVMSYLINSLTQKYNDLDPSLNAPKTILLLEFLSRNDRLRNF